MSFDASLYRALHTGTPGDVAFYRALCAGVETVLELGVGDGRIAIPLAQDGCAVVGLDTHPEMIAAGQAQAGELQLDLQVGDMRAFQLNRKFDRIIIPYNGLYCLNAAEKVQCLQAVADHLNDDGVVAFDGYILEPIEADIADEEPVFVVSFWDDKDRRIDVFEQDAHRPSEGRCDVRYVHHVHQADTHYEVEYTLTHYYLLPEALEGLLAQAGLVIERLVGDFGTCSVSPKAQTWAVVARRCR